MLTSPRYTVSRRELEVDWSFEDLCVAHDTIDLLDDAEQQAAENARREGQRRRKR